MVGAGGWNRGAGCMVERGVEGGSGRGRGWESIYYGCGGVFHENIKVITLCLQGILAKLKDDQTTEVKALMAWVDFHNQDYAEATNK